jgi:hypothetical protein
MIPCLARRLGCNDLARRMGIAQGWLQVTEVLIEESRGILARIRGLQRTDFTSPG